MCRLRISMGDVSLVYSLLRMTMFSALWKVSDCRSPGGGGGGVGGGGGGGGGDSSPRFSSSLPTYLPVSCHIQGADSAYFLRESAQEATRNGSLQTRTEPFLLRRPESGAASSSAAATAPLPSVNCSYGDLTAEAPVPLDLLQSRPRLLGPASTRVTLNWKVRAQPVTTTVGSARPQVQVLFHLTGRRWEDAADAPPPDRLPCVRAAALRDGGEATPWAGCRLAERLGICTAPLELPPAWFTPAPGRRRLPDAPLPGAEVYYFVQPVDGATGDCPPVPKEPWRGPARTAGVPGGAGPGSDPPWDGVRSAGAVRLVVGPVAPGGERMRMDENLEVRAPPSPVRTGQTVAFGIHMRTDSAVEQFTLRALFSTGVNFLSVKPSNLASWEIKQEVIPGSRSLAVFSQRRPSSAGDRLQGASYEVMQVEFEMDDMFNLVPTQEMRWQVEYPGSGRRAEVVSRLYISQTDILGIVALSEDTDIVNTAILTGRRVAVPVKVVTVEMDGMVREVVDAVSCSSTDVDVVKVSPACDLVLVNGKEMRGRQALLVNFTYQHLSAQLELSVWVPRLPLQIHVSDTELSQVKGWRVPIASSKRPTRDSEDDDDDERKGKGCALQYQHALVRVLAHLVAEPADGGGGGDLVHMLGAAWQADVTHLVLDWLKVEDPRVARLVEGGVLVGREEGITTIQVLSPLSDSILAEKTVTVQDDRVSISDLGVQVVASLSLSLLPSPISSQAIALTATAHDLLHAHKQEAAISVWIQYSDGSVTPLDIYDPRDFTLSAVSLDEAVVSTYQESAQRWPAVVAEGEGQGPLVRVEMVISEACQKSKRKSVLAMGVASLRVKFGPDDAEQRGGADAVGGAEVENATSDQRTRAAEGENGGGEGWKHNSNGAAADREEGAMRKVSSTTKTPVTQRARGSKAGGGAASRGTQSVQTQPGDLSSLPAQVEVPSAGESDLSQSPRGLSDLEIGMYALLGVFCLAILVFLINCISFAFRYRHKQLPVLEQGNMNHAHDWVWLGNEADLLERHGDQCQSPHQDECTTIIDRGEAGYEESKFLLNGGASAGGQRGVAHGQTLPRSLSEPRQCAGKDEPPAARAEAADGSPTATSKRKRVKFTSFATVLPNDGGGPYTNSILVGQEDDIKWVCQDMDLGQSEIRTYMERLQDNL